MTVIEGVGDEVTIVAAGISLLFVVMTTFLLRNLCFEDIWSTFRQWEQSFSARRAAAANIAADIIEGMDGRINANRGPDVIPNNDVRRASSTGTNNRDEVLVQNSGNIVNGTTSQTVGEASIERNLERARESIGESNSISTSEVARDGETEPNQTSSSELPNGENVDNIPLNAIRVRLKYLNDTERTVTAASTDTIGLFKRNHFLADLNANKTVRLIFNGQLLRDEGTLQSYRIEDRTVLHVHISQMQTPQNTTASTYPDLDVSNLMWPVFSVMLGLCWVAYIRYPELFSITSIILLIAFSASFLIVYVHTQVQNP